MDEGESPEATAVREVSEEAGVETELIDAIEMLAFKSEREVVEKAQEMISKLGSDKD